MRRGALDQWLRLFIVGWLAGAAPLEASENAFSFLELPESARASAMGGVSVASGDNAGDVRANPATLGLLWRQEVSLSHAERIEDVKHDVLSVALPTLRWGNFSAAAATLSSGRIRSLGNAAEPLGDITAQDTAVSFAYGRAFFAPNFYLGLQGQMVEERLNTVSARTWAGDLGLIWEPTVSHPLWMSRVGVAVKNLGPAAQFDRESAPLPRSIDVGVAWRPYWGRYVVAADARLRRDGRAEILTGMEYWAKNVVCLRAGVRPSFDETRITMGAGFRLNDWQCDYAFTPVGELGQVHQLSLSYRFGNLAQAHYERGLRDMKTGDYARALIHFSKALSYDHRFEKALKKIREASKLIQESEKSRE